MLEIKLVFCDRPVLIGVFNGLGKLKGGAR